MEKPEVVECCDTHYRRAIWGLGPYIGDYPEQILLACVVQGWCARSVSLCRYLYCITNFMYNVVTCRCRAFHENLDDKDLYQRRRTKELTEALINTYEVPILWKEHGIVADVIVRFITTYIFFPASYIC
jgi:hypothetical protein